MNNQIDDQGLSMMRPAPRRHARQGFTLVEMILVISVMTLLIAMLMPALGRSKDSAWQVTCGSNLRQLGIAAGAYELDHLGFLPTHYAGSTPFTTYWMNRESGGKLERVNLGLLLDRAPDPQLYYDPSIAGIPDSALSFNGPDNPWNDSLGNNPSAKDFRLRSSFPARARHAEIGRRGLSHWRLRDHHGKVIYSCFIGADDWNGGGIINGRIVSPHRLAGNNIVFPDGSTHWVNYEAIRKLRPVTSTTPSHHEQLLYYQLLDTRP